MVQALTGFDAGGCTGKDGAKAREQAIKEGRKATMARKVYMATLERFGYNLTVIDTTKAGAMEKLLAGYREAYIRANKTEPEKDLIREFDAYEPDESNRTYMDLAREEICVNAIELGSVWWL